MIVTNEQYERDLRDHEEQEEYRACMREEDRRYCEGRWACEFLTDGEDYDDNGTEVR
jgi:hypothetical protein